METKRQKQERKRLMKAKLEEVRQKVDSLVSCYQCGNVNVNSYSLDSIQVRYERMEDIPAESWFYIPKFTPESQMPVVRGYCAGHRPGLLKALQDPFWLKIGVQGTIEFESVEDARRFRTVLEVMDS